MFCHVPGVECHVLSWSAPLLLVTLAPACLILILSSAASGASRERRVSKDRPELLAAVLRYAPAFAGRRPALLRMRDAGAGRDGRPSCPPGRRLSVSRMPFLHRVPFRSPCRRPARRGGTLFRAYRARLPACVAAGAVRAPDCPRARGRRRTHVSRPFLGVFFAPAPTRNGKEAAPRMPLPSFRPILG